MKRKNGKYNMKGGTNNPEDKESVIDIIIGSFKKGAHSTALIAPIITLGVVFLISVLGYHLINMFISGINKITTCTIMSTIMLILTLITYIVDIIRSLSRKDIKNVGDDYRPIVVSVKDASEQASDRAKTSLEASNLSAFIRDVKSFNMKNMKSLGVYILLGLVYVGSIIISIVSLLSGRNENMDILTTIFKIFVFIFTIISIISINFAIRKDFILAWKIPFYILLPLIALSCADQMIFYTSNWLNIIFSAIIAIFMFLILTPLEDKLFAVGFNLKTPNETIVTA